MNLFGNIFDNILNPVDSFLGKQPQAPSYASPQAPRTASYTKPVVQPKSGYAPGYEGTVDATKSPIFKAIQGSANLFNGVADEAVNGGKQNFDQQLSQKRQAFISDMLNEGHDEESIFQAMDSLQAKGEFDYKPSFMGRVTEGLGNRMQEVARTTETLSKEQSLTKRLGVGTLAYGGDMVATAMEPIASAISPYAQAGIEYAGLAPTVQDMSQKFQGFKERNPLTGEAIEGALNVGQLAPIPVGKYVGKVAKPLIKATGRGIVKGTEVAGKSVVQGVTKVGGAVIKAPQTVVRSGISALEKIKPGIKDDLANIDPQSRYAVERATPERVGSIIEDAKQAKMNPNADYQQTPYHKGAEMGNKTADMIEGNLRKRQNERMAILENVPLERVNLESVRSSLRAELDKLNIEDITIDDTGKPVVVSKQGRSALLDSKNSQDMQAIEKLREVLSEDVSPLQTMDNIKILQEWLYENKGTIALKGISKKMEGIVSKVQGSLNKTFKDQLPPEYKKVMESMSEDIGMSNDIKRLFGIDDSGNQVGNRGELIMKRLTNGTTTGGEARVLADKILKKYGVDLIQEARLRQLSMELVGDTRGANLFGVLLSGKKGMMDWAMGKVGDVLIDKESLIKSYAGKGTIVKQKKQPTLYTNPKKNGTPIRNIKNNTTNTDTRPTNEKVVKPVKPKGIIVPKKRKNKSIVKPK